MTGGRNRQPKGSPNGGEFADTAGTESTVTLEGSPDGIDLARAALVKALAEAAHEDPENVVVDLPLGATRQGWRPAELSVGMGDSWDTKLHLTCWLTPTGEIHDTSIIAEYNQTQERRKETGYDTTSVVLTHFEGPISGAVADVMQLARYQRGLEAQFNGPQRRVLQQRIAAGQFRGPDDEFLHFNARAAGERPIVVVTDSRSSRHEELTIQLVNPGATHTPLAVESATVQTAFGPITASNIPGLHSVFKELERNFTGCTDGSWSTDAYAFQRRLYLALGAEQ